VRIMWSIMFCLLDVGSSIVQEVFGFVKRNRSEAQRLSRR
jgi:hypothetical protein